MASAYSEKDEKPEYWFNLKTLKVEVGKQSSAPKRIGPFSTRLEAEAALKNVAERNRTWEESETD